MTDQEYNENTAKIIKLTKYRQFMRPLSSVKEAMGEWDELLKDREDEKRTYDGLFSDLTHEYVPLTPENRKDIAELKRTLYPLLLIDLYKCYEQKGRLNDAEAVLLEAQSLGSEGAELLLFSLYAEHIREMGKSDVIAARLLNNSFKRVKKIDVFSENIVSEINNEYFHSAALMMLSICYRVFDNDTDKSYECLVNTLRLELPDDVQAKFEEELTHFKKDYWSGKYRYVE